MSCPNNETTQTLYNCHLHVINISNKASRFIKIVVEVFFLE